MKIKCKNCGNIIEGDNRGTFIFCSCGLTGIDQTPYYTRLIGDNFEEIKSNDNILNNNSHNITIEGENKMNDFKLIYTKTKEVKNPVRANRTDAGIDFFIPEDFETTILKPNEDILIDSGIKVVVPEGYALIFKEKSGVATKRKLTIGAAVIDSDYRGVVHFHLFNNGLEPQLLSAGDKITQGLIVPISLCETQEISEEEYSKYENTARGTGGFGSTGDGHKTLKKTI